MPATDDSINLAHERACLPRCMIKIFRGGGVVDGEGGSSARCLKWRGGGSLRDLSKNILKQGVGNGKSCL